MTERTITISGKEIRFRASAAVPRLYRCRFGRDIFKDLGALEKAVNNNKGKKTSDLQVSDLEVFENIAYIMARHADPGVPDSIEEWLEQFEMFSIYEVLPAIIELWNISTKTDVVPKKK